MMTCMPSKTRMLVFVLACRHLEKNYNKKDNNKKAHTLKASRHAQHSNKPHMQMHNNSSPSLYDL